MLDLRRFPVSDGAGVKCYTFCTILDRKQIFDFFELLIFNKRSRDPRKHGNVGNRRAHRMEALSEACGTCFRSKPSSEEPKSRFWPYRHFFPEFWEIWKMENRKKNVGWAEQTFSERMEEIWGQSVGWRSRYVWKTSKSHAKSTREAHSVRWISHFRPCDFWTVGTPDLHRATRNDGPG